MGYQLTSFLKLSSYAIPSAVGVVLCGVYLSRSRSLDGYLMLAGAAIGLTGRLANSFFISFLAVSMAGNVDAMVAVAKGTQIAELAGHSIFVIGFWLLVRSIKRPVLGAVRSQL